MTARDVSANGLTYIAPSAAANAPPLSLATRAGDLLFVSGIPGHDDQYRLPEGFDAQFGFVVVNMKRILQCAGADWRRIVKANVLLTRTQDVARMNELYAQAFGPPPYPARTTCVVHALPDPRMLIEIECVVDMRSV